MSGVQMDLEHFDLAARDGLSPAEIDVYTRVEEDGLSIHRVANIRDTKDSTVRTLLHRARRKRGEQPRV